MEMTCVSFHVKHKQVAGPNSHICSWGVAWLFWCLDAPVAHNGPNVGSMYALTCLSVLDPALLQLTNWVVHELLLQLLASPPLSRGERCMLVGLTKSLRIMQRRSTVTNATVALTIPAAEVPRCGSRILNAEYIRTAKAMLQLGDLNITCSGRLHVTTMGHHPWDWF
jgi:hypothetical protein